MTNLRSGELIEMGKEATPAHYLQTELLPDAATIALNLFFIGNLRRGSRNTPTCKSQDSGKDVATWRPCPLRKFFYNKQH